MSRFFNFLIVVITALALVPAPAVAQSSTYRIAGMVVDALTGQPLSLAEVTLSPVSALNEAQTFLTAADGRFLFTNLAPGKYRLLAVRRAYTLQGFNAHEGYMTAIVAGPGQDSAHLRFRLSPSAVLTGTVSDQWNDPIRDAAVMLFQQSGSAGSRNLHLINRASTDDLGHYRFSHLPPGTYVVGVLAHPWWYNFMSQPVYISKSGAQSGSSTSEFEFLAPQTPQSNVVNPALDVVYPITYFPNVTTLADAARLSLLPGSTESADFNLRPVPSLHIQVRVPTASPADAQNGEQGDDAPPDGSPNITIVQRLGDDDPDLNVARSRPVSPGLVEISGIAPGDATITFSPSQADSAPEYSQSVHLSGNTELDLRPHGSLVDVTGTVLVDVDPANQSPPPGEQLSSTSQIQFRSRKTGEVFSIFISQQSGFSFSGLSLPAGTYELSIADAPNLQVSSIEATGATVSRRTIDISAGQPVKLTVHTAQANCSVAGFALKDGKPVAGAMILLVPQDPDQKPALFHRDQSDSDGSFFMAPIFPGRYTLLAIENGWELEWANPAVLFKYLPSGRPVELLPNAAASLNAKVQ
jgi:protocatechuate 3,4-dioxygenase beta subunit